MTVKNLLLSVEEYHWAAQQQQQPPPPTTLLQRNNPSSMMIGLPSGYPSNRNTMVAASALSEEIQEFGKLYYYKSLSSPLLHQDNTALMTDENTQPRKTSRQKPALLVSLSSSDQPGRQQPSKKTNRRSNALCAQDFQQSILSELFPSRDVVSTKALLLGPIDTERTPLRARTR